MPHTPQRRDFLKARTAFTAFNILSTGAKAATFGFGKEINRDADGNPIERRTVAMLCSGVIGNVTRVIS